MIQALSQWAGWFGFVWSGRGGHHFFLNAPIFSSSCSAASAARSRID
jgi:hypothetical protein